MAPRQFQFRLQSVLEYKQRQEEEQQRKLAELQAVLIEEENTLASLKRFRQKRLREMSEKSQAGAVNVEELKMYHEQQRKLEADIAAQAVKVEQAKAAVDEQMLKLLEARQEVMTYEKLKEKHYEDYLAQINLEEQKLIDEIATTKYNRENPL